jgi:hypothetical protein
MGRKRANLICRADLWVSENRGQLTGLAYKPFLTVRDVPSHGRSHRILSWTVNRQHHLFSDFEASFFYLADYSKSITDIREQYPLLPLEETLAIATRLGIKHPGRSGRLHVVTTDFVLTRVDGALCAVACKLSRELKKRRVRDKLAIEKWYWLARGVPWYIVTEKEIPKLLVSAVKWVHNYQSAKGLPLEQILVTSYLEDLRAQLRASPHSPFGPQCLMVDAMHSVEPGTGLSLVRHALSIRNWRVDLRAGIDTMAPLAWIEEV